MNEKSNGAVFIVGLVCLCIGTAIGYGVSIHIRSSEAARLAEEYDTAKRERDEAVSRIAEDNQRLRDGAARALVQLDQAEARVNGLEEYIRSAGAGNQEIIASAGETRSNLEEASRIIGSYLGEQQTPESDADNRDPCRGGVGYAGRLGAE
jgi:hypothetical protein